MHIIKLCVAFTLTSVSATVVVASTEKMHTTSHEHVHMAQPVAQPLIAHEHGDDIFMSGSLENTWLSNEHGESIWSTAFKGWIGSDENKLFILAHQEKEASDRNTFDATALYSRNIAPFWDAQLGVKYQQDDNLPQDRKRLNAVFGVHGLAPYFFETNAHVYLGQRDYAAIQLEMSRDILLTQKLILGPYVDTTWVMQDRSTFGSKTGLKSVETGVKVRYEINKVVMPFIDLSYHYKAAPKNVIDAHEAKSDHTMYAGAGLLLKF